SQAGGGELICRRMEALRLVSEGFLLLSGTPALSALEFAEAARRRRGCWCSSRLDVDEGAGARRGRSSTRGGGVLPGWLDVDEERRGARRGWWRSSRAVAALQGWATENCLYYTQFWLRTVSAPLLRGVLILLEGDYSAWRRLESSPSAPGRSRGLGFL